MTYKNLHYHQTTLIERLASKNAKQRSFFLRIHRCFARFLDGSSLQGAPSIWSSCLSLTAELLSQATSSQHAKRPTGLNFEDSAAGEKNQSSAELTTALGPDLTTKSAGQGSHALFRHNHLPYQGTPQSQPQSESDQTNFANNESHGQATNCCATGKVPDCHGPP